jgi:hypothetical protein
MTIKFTEDPDEKQVIAKIAERAHRRLGLNAHQTEMDISATHANGCPLRLDEFLNADDWNFCLDLKGIIQNLNREAGRLAGWFVPRHAL